MDKSQLLLEKMDLPRTKNFRFSVIMKNFSLISLIIILLYAVLFALVSAWQMVLVCGRSRGEYRELSVYAAGCGERIVKQFCE